MTLKQLREARAARLKQAQDIVEGDSFDQSEFDSHMTAIADLDAQIGAAEQLANKVVRESAADGAAAIRADRDGISVDQARDGVESWMNALGAWMRSQHPLRHYPISDAQRDVLLSNVVDASTDAKGASAVVSDDVAGDMFFEILKYQAPMLDLVTVERRMRGTKAHAPNVDDNGHYGRILSRGTARQAQDPNYGKSTFEFDMFDSDWLKASYEALEDMDVGDLAASLMNLAARRVARLVNWVITRGVDGTAIANVGSGTGAANRGTPNTDGIVTAATAGLTTAGAAILPEEFVKFTDALDPAYERGRERLMAAKSTITALRTIKDGDGRFLFEHERVPAMERMMTGSQAVGGEQPVRGSLGGVPYVLNNEMAAIAAGSVPAVYGDLRAYHLFMLREIQVERHHDSQTSSERQVWFAATQRAAGVLLDTNAVKKLTMHS